jgi:hypothetical protein
MRVVATRALIGKYIVVVMRSSGEMVNASEVSKYICAERVLHLVVPEPRRIYRCIATHRGCKRHNNEEVLMTSLNIQDMQS